ncbi:hypothetical protein JOB18_020554 [Solea senegalensis]|uniref:Uncharacterized protein n=1 Tax=Solea senegalensis TaxID=28829 RepID=A0AAV6PH09_SOLSE|nr:hypothetical protein JOB18_020554 [Solea senegalensis]
MTASKYLDSEQLGSARFVFIPPSSERSEMKSESKECRTEKNGIRSRPGPAQDQDFTQNLDPLKIRTSHKSRTRSGAQSHQVSVTGQLDATQPGCAALPAAPAPPASR